MTRIWLFSDLHLTTPAAHFPAIFPDGLPDADVCVVAGDLFEGDPEAGIEWLDRHIGGRMEIAYILGNHEFYSREQSMDRARDLAGRAAVRTQGRVNVLDDMSLTVSGIRILGTTLWSDFQLYGSDSTDMERSMAVSQAHVNDFRIIRRDDRSTKIWSPNDARAAHFKALDFLHDQIQTSQKPCVVVSHHAPHVESLHPEHERDFASAAFVSDLDGFIRHEKPVAWLHGHTHHTFSYTVGETVVRCNPKGYGRENQHGFDPGLVIEIEAYSPKPPGL